MTRPAGPAYDPTYGADPFEQSFAATAGPTHWASIPLEQQPQAWADLTDWVESLVDRFALDIHTVPPCWARHNGIVEALSALRDHERACFADNASPTAAVDWFRAFREIEARLAEAASRTQCSVKEHRPDFVRQWQSDSSNLGGPPRLVP